MRNRPSNSGTKSPLSVVTLSRFEQHRHEIHRKPRFFNKLLEEDTNNQLFVLRESFKSFAYENRSVLESIRYFFAHRKQNESLMGYTDGEKWAKECLDVTYRYVCGLLNPPKNTLLLTDGTKVSSPDRIETVHDEPAVEDIEDAEFEDVPAENSAAVESDPATIAVPGAPVYEEKIAYPRYANGKSTSLIDEVTHSDYDYETQIKILRIVIGNLQAAIPEIEAEIKAAA